MSIRKWKYSAVSCQFRISGLLPGPIAGDVSHPGYNHATYDLYTNLEDSTCTLYSLNPILDTRRYSVKFNDGDVTELTANVIAEAMYAQYDGDGNLYTLLGSIIDHERSKDAVSLSDQKVIKNGKTYIRKSTAGWKLCCEWKDGSTSWEKLSILKESHPVKAAKYAISQGIEGEPAFNWWVRPTIKKMNSIISSVKQRQSQDKRKTHKWGIRVPATVKEALAMDTTNKNTLWADAIAKEMRNVRVAFDTLPDGENPPPGYQFVRCHMIFDVKMEDFRRKARLVALEIRTWLATYAT